MNTHAITANTYSPRTPKLYKGCPFLHVIKKICSAIHWIFKKIGEIFKRKKSTLSSDDLQWIKNARRLGSPQRVSPRDPAPNLSRKQPCQIPSSVITPSQITKLPEIENPVMRDFHDEMLSLCKTTINAVYDCKKEPVLEFLNSGLDDASTYLKLGANFAIPLLDKAAPLLDYFKEYEFTQQLEADYRTALCWLKKEGIPAELSNTLFDKTSVKNEIIAPFIEWLESDLRLSLADFYTDKGIDVNENKEDIDKILEKTLSILVERKINRCVNLCHERLKGDLPEIVQKMVVDNGKKISSILIRRLFNLLEELHQKPSDDKPSLYSHLFDQILGTLDDHIQTAVNVKSERKLAPRKIKKSLKDNQDPDESRRAEEMGIDEYIKKNTEVLATKKYCESKVCHPLIAEINSNPNMTRENAFNTHFNQHAKEILPLLLPKYKIELQDGSFEEIDGLIYLTNQIEIPNEIQEIIRDVKQIAEEVITPETKNSIKKAFDDVWDFAYHYIEAFILKEARKHIREGIEKAFLTMIQDVFTKDGIRNLSAQFFFPAIQSIILNQRAHTYIEKDLAHYAEKFPGLIQITEKVKNSKELPEEESEKLEKEKDQKLKEIAEELLKKAKEDSREYNKEMEKMPIEEYQQTIELQIEQIMDQIWAYLHKKEGEDAPIEKITPEFVKEAFETCIFHEGQSVKGVDSYGRIINNLLFNLGGLKGKMWFSLIQVELNKGITSGTKDMRESSHSLLRILTKGLQRSKPTPEQINTLFFGKKEEKQNPQDILPKEIAKTAKLTHDYIMQTIDEKIRYRDEEPQALHKKIGNLFAKTGNQAVKKIARDCLGQDAQKLTEVISDVFDKVLGKDHMTQNLFLQMNHFLLEAFRKASEKLEAVQIPLKVDRRPNLIPAALYSQLN